MDLVLIAIDGVQRVQSCNGVNRDREREKKERQRMEERLSG